MLKHLSGLALLAVASLALAQDTYRVDSASGPLTLPEEVEAAFLEWQDAGATTVPGEQAEAETLFRFASPDLLGPDIVSLTLQNPDAEPSLEILLQPDLYRNYPAALLHEAGLVLGLTQQAQGVMHARLAAGVSASVTQEDVALLRTTVSAVPGDLTGDGIVDFHDLLELAEQFSRRGINLPADLDGDGVVSMADLTELRRYYTFGPPTDTGTLEEPQPEPKSEQKPEAEAESESVSEQEQETEPEVTDDPEPESD